MHFLHKTFTKTPNHLLQQALVHLSRISSSSYFFSTIEFQSNVLEIQAHAPMEKKDETEGEKRGKNLTRPSQIPFQSKVANWVNLIGTVRMPVEFFTSSDEKSWAGTVISQQQQLSSALPLLWIPVIFEGDLAHTAAAHLKEMDIVYVAGHLSSDPVPINLTNGQVNVRVMVHDVHFVRGFHRMNKHLHRSQQRSRTD